MAKKRRISQVTKNRWGVGPARHRSATFVDRKKKANRNACRNKKLW